ncbi:MAG: hypothetical protein WC756_06705, partial [Taibaiella sp.]
MKKIFLLTLFSLCLNISFSQSGKDILIFDKGSGTYESLQVGNAVMNAIQENNLSILSAFYIDLTSFNNNDLRKEMDVVNKTWPYYDTIAPIAYLDDSESNFYYERNFCNFEKNNVTIELQIHATLIKEGNSYYVNQIQFRRGKAIQKRQAEVKDILSNNQDETLRPPPPPP